MFLCLSPETNKNAEGIDGVLVDFRRELVLVRKYDSTTADQRNEGFTWFGGFICFCLKKTAKKELSIIFIRQKGVDRSLPHSFPLAEYYSAAGAVSSAGASAAAASAALAASASAFFSATFLAIASFTFFSSARPFS